MTIFSKVRVITLSTIHTVLDRVIDMNSPGALEQYERDMQQVRDTLDNQEARQGSRVDSLPDAIATLTQERDDEQAMLDTFILKNDPKDVLKIKQLQVHLNSLEDQIKSSGSRLQDSQGEQAKFQEAVSKLDVRLAEVRSKIVQLKDMKESSDVKHESAQKLASVDLGAMPDTSKVEERLRENAAVSDRELDRGLSRLVGATADPVRDMKLDLQVQKRREELLAKQKTA